MRKTPGSDLYSSPPRRAPPGAVWGHSRSHLAQPAVAGLLAALAVLSIDHAGQSAS